MSNVQFDQVKLAAIAVGGEGTMRELHKTAKAIEREAKTIYLAERKLPDHNEYLNSFSTFRSGRSYIVTNTDDVAFYVEFGAHIYPHGNKNADRIAVLGYAPLRRAVDIVSSYH